MGSSKAPKSPDPKETAAAQTGTNVSTALANAYLGNINQVTPDGSMSYTYGPTKTFTDPTSGAVYEIPQTTVTQTLSKSQQAIKGQTDLANKNLATLAATQSGKLNNILGTPFDINGAPQAADPSQLQTPQYQNFSSGPQLQTGLANAGDITRSYDTDYSGNVMQVQDALMQRLNPSLTQNREALEQSLANRGLQPGSEAYNRALDTATRQENDARLGVIAQSGQEQNRLASLANQQATFQNSAQQQAYNQNLQTAGFGNEASQQMFQNQNTATGANNALQDQYFNAQQSQMGAQNQARSNYLNEQYALRNQPINEISSLLSGAQVTQPNFVNAQNPQLPTVDYAGLVNQDYQNKLGAYQQKQAGIGAALGGLAGLFTLSDRDAKKNIKKVGGLYEYNYKDDPKGAPKRIGVMAQEVSKIRPDAVRQGSDGYKRVNYGLLFEAGGK